MPTTSNFGWTTPADTDLVKDGAAAIRTLGNGIDTSFLDLKGGTTDQVLAKNSNTDLDFKWVAQDDSNAIQNAIVDAKGDLIAASAADTPARLAVGTDGQYLQADSTASTGLKWASISAGGMTLLSTTTLNGAAAYTVSSISGSYINLYILIVGSKTGTETNKNRIKVSSSASNNNTITRYGSASGTSNLGEAITLDADQLYTKSTTTTNSYAITIFGYANTEGYKPIQFNSVLNDSTTKIHAMGSGSYADTAAITQITYENWAGANYTGGTMYIYGVK